MDRELERLRQRLIDEGRRVVETFTALPPAAWDQPVYTTDPGWRVRHILAHFVSSERTYLAYLRQAVAGGDGVPRDFDIDAFNRTEVPTLEPLPPPDLLAAFEQARAETVAFVSSLSPADLQRRGYHPWFGDADMLFILKLLYRHPMIHLRDVRQAVETGAPVPHNPAAARPGGGAR